MLGKEKKIKVAETDFNLAKYCESTTVVDKLELRKESSFTDFEIEAEDVIEVQIKTQILENDAAE